MFSTFTASIAFYDFSEELAQVQLDLIRNLQEFLEKHEFDKRHQLREQGRLEEKRLALLRRERVGLVFTVWRAI